MECFFINIMSEAGAAASSLLPEISGAQMWLPTSRKPPNKFEENVKRKSYPPRFYF
jgi:hypothetical protein